MTKVLGIGNALVDIMTILKDDETLEQFNLPKGSMQLVDADFSDRVNKGTDHLQKSIASGGSAANTIHGLAKMDIKTGFIGKVGQDEFGQIFRDDLLDSKITPLLQICTTTTGKAMALISPDSERTFATYLGAAVEMVPEDLLDDFYKGYDYLHIEGYLVQNHELIEQAVKLAKKHGLKVSLDMASYNVVEDNLDFLKKIVSEYVDIVFANEEEAKSFSGKEPEEALHIFGDQCEIAVVKVGKAGSLIKHKGTVTSVKPIIADPVDTTGAGDLYAAGFLYGLIQKKSMETCGNMGSILAGKTIEVIGPKMNESQWNEVKTLVAAL